MPLYLKDIGDFQGLKKFESVLIVPYRFCRAASFAVRKGEPYFEFLRKFLKTASYDRCIEKMKADLEKRGVKADVFKSRLFSCPFEVFSTALRV